MCWGSDQYNQSIVPVDLSTGVDVIASGDKFTCASSKTLFKCFGNQDDDYNNKTKLSNLEANTELIPQEFRGGVKLISVGT